MNPPPGSDDRNGPGAAAPGRLLAPLDDRPGPARRLSSAAAAAMVESVVEAALAAPAPVPDEEGRAAPRAGALRRRHALAFAAALLVALSVGAAAGVGGAALVSRLTEELARRPERHREAAPATRREPRGSGDRALDTPATPPSQPTEAPAPPAEPQAASGDRERDLRLRHVEPGNSQRRRSPPATARLERRRPFDLRALEPGGAEPARPRAGEIRPEAVDPETAPPEDLLALANQRRRALDFGEADRLYRMAMARFPGSDAAVVAEIASATLHLEQLGDAPGALRGYRRTLEIRPSGPLAEEARWGIAQVERALGDRAAEAAALQDFLTHHPRSALAPSARRRRAELVPGSAP